MSVTQLAGVLPALVFPAATAAQLIQIVRTRSTAGVSTITWTLFGGANVALYVYTERFAEWQAIVGMLATAVLDFAIAALAYRRFGIRSAPAEPPKQGLRIVSQEPASRLHPSHS